MTTENDSIKTIKSTGLKDPQWNIWQVLYLILIVYLVEFVLGWLKQPDAPGSLRGFLNYLLTGFGEGLIFFIAIIIFLKVFHRPMADLGLVSINFNSVMKGLAGGVFLFFAVGLLGNVLVEYLGDPDPQSFSLVLGGANSIWQLVLLIILGGMIVPLQEEIVFRGLIYPTLRKGYGRWKGIIVSAIFFASMHFDIIRFLPLLLGGIVLAWLYEKSKSLWPSIIAHGVWNILMTFLMWFQKG